MIFPLRGVLQQKRVKLSSFEASYLERFQQLLRVARRRYWVLTSVLMTQISSGSWWFRNLWLNQLGLVGVSLPVTSFPQFVGRIWTTIFHRCRRPNASLCDFSSLSQLYCNLQDAHEFFKLGGMPLKIMIRLVQHLPPKQTLEHALISIFYTVCQKDSILRPFSAEKFGVKWNGDLHSATLNLPDFLPEIHSWTLWQLSGILAT